MTRLIVALAAVAGVSGCSASSAPAPVAVADPTGPRLIPGAAAPALPALEWVRGEAVPAFKPGTVYVIDFWATWCGPCRAMFPETAALAERYTRENCVFLAVSAADPSNSRGAVAEYAAGRGADYPFRWAFDPDRKAYAAFMEAAGRTSIPTTFAIDRAGKLAWIGHPSDLEGVLPDLLAGTWDPKTGPEKLRAEEAALDDILAAVDSAAQLLAANLPAGTPAADAKKQIREVQSRDAKAALPKLAAYAAAHPARAARPGFALSLLTVHLAAGDAAAAKPYADRVLAGENPALLEGLVDRWTNPGLNETRAVPEVATAGAAKLLALDLPGPTKYIAAGKAAAFAGDAANRDKYLAAAMKGVKDQRDLKAIRAAVAAAE